MASIIGEKYKYASSDSLVALDSRIAEVQADYTKWKTLYEACKAGKNRSIFYSCNKNQGFSSSSLYNHYYETKVLLENLKKERTTLAENLASQAQIQAQTAKASQETASAAEKTASATGKWVIVAFLGVAAIAGGIFLFKKFKN